MPRSGRLAWIARLLLYSVSCVAFVFLSRANSAAEPPIPASHEQAQSLGLSSFSPLSAPLSLAEPREGKSARKSHRLHEPIQSPQSLPVPQDAHRPSGSSTHTTWRPRVSALGPNLLGPRLQSSEPSLSPSPSAIFEAANDDGEAIVPDSSGAVGTNHIVTVLNTLVRVQDRAGQVVTSTTLDRFFSPLVSDIFCYHPRCVFDPYAGRWIIVAGAEPDRPNPGIAVAVSATEDPTGDWFRYYIPVDPTSLRIAYRPMIGFNGKWIVLQANVHSQTTGDFLESQVFVLNKTNFYAGGSGDLTRFHLKGTDYGGGHVPALTMDPTLPVLYLANNWSGYDLDPVSQQAQGFLRIYSLAGDVGAEALTPGAFVGTAQEVATPFFTWADSVPNSNDLGLQNGNTNRLQLGDSRIQSLMYRGQSLWCSQTVLLPAADPTRSGVQWWEIFPDGRLFQRQLVNDPTGQWSYAYPSMAVNDHFDVLMGYNGFAASVYPSAYYRFFPNSGTTNDPEDEHLMRAGLGSYVERYFGQNRWGDWSTTCVDPVNDGALWTLQEHALEPTPMETGRWAVDWALVTPRYDLEISSAVSTNRVLVGQSFAWTISVSNRIRSFGYNGLVTAPIPAGVEVLSVTPSAGVAEIIDGVLYWSPPRIGLGAVTCQVSGRATGDSLSLSLVSGVVAFGIEDVVSNNSTSSTVALSPGNPLFSPRVAFEPNGGGARVSWPVGFFNFIVESKSDLNDPKWSPVAATVQSDSTRRWVDVPVGTGSRYYRVRLP